MLSDRSDKSDRSDRFGVPRLQSKAKHKGGTASKKIAAKHSVLRQFLLFVCNRWMQRATRSCFATSMVQECTTVLDCTSAEARREIDHDAPPQVWFFTKIFQKVLKKMENIFFWQNNDIICLYFFQTVIFYSIGWTFVKNQTCGGASWTISRLAPALVQSSTVVHSCTMLVAKHDLVARCIHRLEQPRVCWFDNSQLMWYVL